MTENEQTGSEAAASGAVEVPAEGKPPGPKFKLVAQPAPLEESYADGALGVMVRGAVFKLDLYRVVGNEKEGGDELWSNSHRIVFPITAAPQMIGMLQRMVEGMEKAGILRREPPPGSGGG